MAEKKKFDINDISDLLVAGAKRAWAEKEPIALIGFLLGAVTVAFLWPVVRVAFSAMNSSLGDDPAATEALVQELIGLAPYYLVMMMLSTAALVMLARLATRGRAETLTGGVPALSRRVGWVLWRHLGMAGWLVQGLLALWLAGMVIGMVGGGNLDFLKIVLMVPLVGGMLLLFSALGLSLISESADHHLTIHRAWKLLQGQRIIMAASLVMVYLGLLVINRMLMILAPKAGTDLEGVRMTLSALHIAITILGTFATFTWFSMAAVVAEKIDWSEPEAETQTGDPDD